MTIRGGRGRKLRVLLLLDRLTSKGGGAERFVVGLATHLPRERCEVVVCTTRAGRGTLSEALREAGIEHVGLERRHRLDLAPFLRLLGLVRRGRFDVLHAHKFGSNVWGTIFGRLGRVPVVVAQEHTWSYEGQPLRKALDRELIGRFADSFVAVSTRDGERMVSVEGVPAQKVRVIPAAYIPRRDGRTQDLRAELGIARDVPLVGAAAVLRPQKALHVLLEAFARVLRELPAARLLLAGDGPCRADLERQAEELGIAGSVSFLGWRDDVDSLLEAVDVAAMSSRFEGTPLFAFECMAHGTPLVSTDVGGIRDLLEPGREVLLVPPDEPAQLGDALVELLRDPERRAVMARDAGARLHRFLIGTVAGEFADLYEELAAAKARA